MTSEPARVTLALLAAAAASATVFVAVDVGWLLTMPGEGDTLGFAAQSALFLWPVAFIVALVHAVVLGLPAYFVLNRRGLTQWWISLIGGFAVGALPYAVLALPWQAPPPDLVEAHIIRGFTLLHYAAMAGGLGLLGMAGGFAAWLVWRGLGRQQQPAVTLR